MEAADIGTYRVLELRARLERDADVHHANACVKLAGLDIVTQHRRLALDHFRQRRTDLAEANNEYLPLLHWFPPRGLLLRFHAARSGPHRAAAGCFCSKESIAR